MLYRGTKSLLLAGSKSRGNRAQKPVPFADAVPLLPTASQVSFPTTIDRFRCPFVEISQSSKLMIEPCSAT